MQHLIYLHGFLSSPASIKAQQTLEYCNTHYPSVNLHIPQLPGDINKAVKKIDALVRTLPKAELRFIGSSMGGYLSTYFVEKFGGKAVLVNPAVEPFNLLKDYLGKHINPYSQEEFYISMQSLNHVYRYYQESLAYPEDYLVLLQTDDETLDYRLAQSKYRNSNLLIEQGGNHSFVGYENHLPKIIDFLR